MLADVVITGFDCSYICTYVNTVAKSVMLQLHLWHKLNTIVFAAKIVARILKRRTERKIEDVFGGDQFGFITGKGTRDATGMLRIISEWTLDMNEWLRAFFINWQKAFDRVHWTKLMQLLKETGIDWRERRSVSKLHIDQSVKINWTKGIQEVWSLEEELHKDAVHRKFCLYYTTSALSKALCKCLDKHFALWNMQMTLC